MDTVLIVDDDASIRLMLKDFLVGRGYKVGTAVDGRNALFVSRELSPDIILLDVMMPELDGFDFVRAFRKESSTPIVMVTARVDEPDKLEGLHLGADDYVTKPFSLNEIEARIQAILRRVRGIADTSSRHAVRGVVLDRATRQVMVGGSAVSLTTTEFELLATLIENPGRVFSRDSLLECLHGFDVDGVARTIDVHIRNLRSKIEPDPPKPVYITTVYGVGYRFAAD